MEENIISTPQKTDPGSHSSLGFDYQKQLTVYLCINMIRDKDVKYIVCEFHEDVLEVKADLRFDLIQIKMNSSSTWALEKLITPDNKQKLSMLGKLFQPVLRKDVTKVAFWGTGKIERFKGDSSLALEEFIYLLKTPEEARNKNRWEEYILHIETRLEEQGIPRETTQKAIEMLEIKLDFPGSNVIEYKNRELLNDILNEVYSVELTPKELSNVYLKLFDRVRNISNKPNQHWADKSISREQITELVFNEIKDKNPSGNRQEVLTTQDKFSRVGLGDKTHYAFQMRINAMWIKYELGIGSSGWEDYKTKISRKINKFRKENPGVMGPALWEGIRNIFSDLGGASHFGDPRIDQGFFEGVFFDMPGICEAQWMRADK